MIKFLFKGIIRDKSRSMLPIIVISLGVSLTIVLSGFLSGAMTDMVDQNAKFDTGHVKIMSRAYAENKDQLPNDLALLGVDSLMTALQVNYPDLQWVKRIRFGGLLDAPDGSGESKGQGPAAGIAINLLDASSGEVERMNITNSIVSGNLPKNAKEALIGDEFASKLNLKIGDEVTYFGTTMNGSMTFQNFIISGTIRFGLAAMDRGAILLDITAAQEMLDMEDGTGEILGFYNNGVYDDKAAIALETAYNEKMKDNPDEYAPEMFTLRAQNNLGDLLDYANNMSAIFVIIFVGAMSVVLWNTGLIGGLRRYQEFGIRLALGESKGKIYRSLVLEATLIGIIGSLVGTSLGLLGVFYLQNYGINIEGMVDNSSMMMPTVMRAKVTPDLYYIGFIPGVFAMVFGNMLSGIGIYKRETATLFKELEV
ncbi:ABC transporter permease [Cyclobacterium amurskyense]|uniref:Lipoprotein releasing system transmembrane protein n=1 Tax=Cyclobacterium amurskyense TaxID=320787 RepID=A0A0H4PKJ3_9BACT|nr:FtsX-like permease family protein [Cyclobacterium amurskyense]AKP53513.1 Lipoprotein releasing system transmembrane protein [Cyclobacterium amurskyense]